MASIVQRNKSYSVVYTIYDGEKKRQKWETYHSYEAALRRKEQLDLIQQHGRNFGTIPGGICGVVRASTLGLLYLYQ